MQINHFFEKQLGEDGLFPGWSLLPWKQINSQSQQYPEFFKRLYPYSSSSEGLKGNSFKQEDRLSNNARKEIWGRENPLQLSLPSERWVVQWYWLPSFFFFPPFFGHWKIPNVVCFHYRFWNTWYMLNGRCTSL